MTRQLGGALCPACLVALALGEDDEPSNDGTSARSPVHAYQLVSVLARERGRATYLARRQDFHAFVSLEMIDGPTLASLSPHAIEARVAGLRSLRHPAIARVLEAWAEPSGEWCLVSDYLAGRAVSSGAGDVSADVLAIFDRLCDALAAAHGQGVMHGRLDAASVVLVGTSPGVEPRLTGFTLADPPPTLAGDLAGLHGILVALTADQPCAAAAASLADRTFATVSELRAAAATLVR